MYRIAICDDEQAFVERIYEIVSNYCERKNYKADIGTFQSSGELLDQAENSKLCDIYILDIQLPDSDGLEPAKRIKALFPQAIIILVTAHTKYAVDAFEASVFRYIPKDQLKTRLVKALEDAFALLTEQEGKSYVINNNRRFERIYYGDIVYICKKEKNVVFVLESHEETSVRSTLTAVYETLNSEEFFCVDRCYIVNLLKVKKIENGKMLLTNGFEIEISAAHLGAVKRAVNIFWGRRI